MKLICIALTAFLTFSFRQADCTLNRAFPVFAIRLLIMGTADALFPVTGPVLPLLLTVSLHDIKTGEIPDITHLVIICTAFSNGIMYPQDALAILLVLTPFSIPGLLGFGDVKLLACLTLLTGRRGWMVLPLASVIALPRAVIKRDRTFPFAPFLSLSFAVILLYQHLAG